MTTSATAATWDQTAEPRPLLPPPPPPPHADGPDVVPRWGLGDVAITFGVWLGVNLIGGVILVVIFVALGYGTEDIENPTAWMTIGFVVVSWLGFLAWPLTVMKLKGSGRPDRDFGLAFKPVDIAWAMAGFAAFWAFNAAATVIFTLVADGEPPTNTDLVDSATTSTAALIALFIAVGLVTPVVEELVFRGFVLRAIGKRYGAPIAIAGSSIPFGMMHFQGGWGGLWIIGLLSVYGAILALLTVRNDGRLGAAIICHAINNSIAVLVVGLG